MRGDDIALCLTGTGSGSPIVYKVPPEVHIAHGS